MFGLFGSKCERMSMQDARIELDKHADVLLLDVRTPEEYRQGHIPGSINLPLDRLQSGLSNVLPDKQARVFVYCLSGSRSQSACSYMSRVGYEQVTNIGGIMSWRGPVVTGSEQGHRNTGPDHTEGYRAASDF